MNKNPILILLASSLVAACAQPGSPPGMMPTNCSKMDLPVNCKDLAGSPPAITINAMAMAPSANPPNACAHPGMTIQFKVAPPNYSKVVAILPKDAADTWLLAFKPADSDTFTITVPEDVKRYKDYDYLIVTGDGGCTDPRIHVD